MRRFIGWIAFASGALGAGAWACGSAVTACDSADCNNADMDASDELPIVEATLPDAPDEAGEDDGDMKRDGGGRDGKADGGTKRGKDAGAEDAGDDRSDDADANGCVIDGKTYATGDSNPSNSCQACDSNADATGWVGERSGSSCGGTSGGTCASGTCVMPTSCAPGGDGMTNCGDASENCCTSLDVKGGTYFRTYTNTGTGPTGEADPATVSQFRLDKYDVSVGRFRQFVAAWNGGNGWLPKAGSGKHTHLNGGKGLVNSATQLPDGGEVVSYETGWEATDWNNTTYVDPTNANLACGTSDYATWTDTATTQESLPINCVNWYEAYAFCIWDGGFLPSDAEWGFAAAGGGGTNGQREYPWGSIAPGTACPGAGCEYAIYNCDYPSGSGTCSGVANIAPVGYATSGAGAYGQLDLGGSLYQWTLDWYLPNTLVDPCIDCAYLSSTTSRAIRGGIFYGDHQAALSSRREGHLPTDTDNGYVGVRCARTQ